MFIPEHEIPEDLKAMAEEFKEKAIEWKIAEGVQGISDIYESKDIPDELVDEHVSAILVDIVEFGRTLEK